jgi:FAD/FMN-containing dehydrogenase
MAKLMIGSFGTLAAIAVVNFKLSPMPEIERSFLLPFASLAEAIQVRDAVVNSVLQPSAIDLLNPEAGATLGNRGWLLAIRTGGNAAVIERYEREFAKLGDGMAFDDERQATLWSHVERVHSEILG